jgi:hypothetical protein
MQPYGPYHDFVVWNPFNKKKKKKGGKTMEKTVLSGKFVPHNCQFKISYLSPNPSVHLSSPIFDPQPIRSLDFGVSWFLDPSVDSP